MQPASAGEKYHFADFTTSHYRELLQLAKRRYRFITFDEAKDVVSNCILWRHDVDFSMHRAWRLAQIEQEEGTIATYFLHLHSEYYNLLEKEITLLARQIEGAGHRIGLHFDTHYYNIEQEEELEDKLRFEKKVLEDFIGVQVTVFSFHNTSPFTMNCQAYSYGGLINTYASYFKKEFEYCSDSNGYWRFKRLREVLENTPANQLQVLTHPEWWQDDIMSPWQRIDHCITERANRNRAFYEALLRRNGMKNIDWNGIIP